MTNLAFAERGRLRPRRALLALSTVLCSGLAAPALGQTVPPTKLTLDQNNVDLVDGSFNLSQLDVSVGDISNGGLAYIRYAGRTGWTTNIQVNFYVNVGPTATYVFVQTGQIADKFLKSGSVYTSVNQTGATLTVSGTIYTYLSADGIEIQASITEPEPGNRLTRINYVKFPNGERRDYTYIVPSVQLPGCTTRPCQFRTYQRLSSVNNTNGYQLKFGYQGNSPLYANIVAWQTLTEVKAINNAVDYCNPAANTCAGLTVSWPTATYASTTVGSLYQSIVTDPLGRVWKYTGPAAYTAPTAVRRPGSSVDTTLIGYSGTTGRVSSITKDGVSWTYNFVDVGNVRTATVTDAASNQRQVVSDIALERMTSSKDELNRTTSYQNDTAGRVTRITQPEGNYTSYIYDGRGNVTEQRSVAKTPGTPPDIVTTAGFDASCANIRTCNQPNWTRDALANQTDYTYDPTHGGVLTVKSPAPTTGGIRPETRVGYSGLQAYYKNSAGSVVASGFVTYRPTQVSTCRTTASCIGGADEVKTTSDYGPQVAGTANNLLPVGTTTGAGDGSLTATATASYDAIGNRTYVDGPLSGTADITRTLYDAARQPVGLIGPDPDGGGALLNRATRLTYNLDGQVTLAESGTTAGQSDSNWTAFSPLQSVVSTYDANARKTTDKLQFGGTAYALTQYSYDTLGRPECTATRMNTGIYGALPSSACTLGTAGSFGDDRIARTVYDVAGQVTKTQLAVGTADASDEATFAYTNNGKAMTLVDGNGNKTTYEYDGFDRVIKTRYPSPTTPGTSSTTDFVQPSYNANSSVTAMRLRDGQSIGYAYDDLNRVITKDVPNTVTGEYDATYAYDLLSRLTSITDTTSTAVTLGYDALGRQVSEGYNGVVKTMQYDLAGRLTRLSWPDGLYAQYDRLVTGEVSAIRENGAASGAGVLGTYAYDNLGRRTGVTRGNGVSTTYGFASGPWLASLSHDVSGTSNDVAWSYSYNPAGQIAGTSRDNDAYAYTALANKDAAETPNGLNQLVTQASTSLTYDGRGNASSIGSTAYTYTSENRLTTAQPSGTGAGLLYDIGGRLWQMTQGSSVTRFDHVGSRMISELSATNTVQRRYVPGSGTDETLVWYEGAGTTDRRWLLTDERGSTVAITDGSGVVTNKLAYDDYGTPLSSNTGRFQYTGQAWLPELGMSYYKARIYAPSIGRFVQTDPIGYGSGVNLYAYVSGDPVNRIDPTGMLSCEEQAWQNFRRTGEITAVACSSGSGIIPWSRGNGNGNSDGGRGGGGGGGAIPGVLEIDYDLNDIIVTAKQFVCQLPPLQVTAGADAYLGIGASGSLGGSLDLSTGQIRLITESALGVGVGGGIGVNFAAGSRTEGASFASNVTASYGPSATLSAPVKKFGELPENWTDYSFSGGAIGWGARAGIWGNNTITYTSEPTSPLYNICE